MLLMNLRRKKIILGKESTLLMLMPAFLIKQNPKKYKHMSWLFYSCKIVYIRALMIIVLVKKYGGKIADYIEKKKATKDKPFKLHL